MAALQSYSVTVKHERIIDLVMLFSLIGLVFILPAYPRRLNDLLYACPPIFWVCLTFAQNPQHIAYWPGFYLLLDAANPCSDVLSQKRKLVFALKLVHRHCLAFWCAHHQTHVVSSWGVAFAPRTGGLNQVCLPRGHAVFLQIRRNIMRYYPRQGA